MRFSFYKKMIHCFLICGLLLCCDCAAPQQESEQPANVAEDTPSSTAAVSVPTAGSETEELSQQEAAVPITDVAFQEQLDLLVSERSGEESITLETVAQIAPQLAEMIDQDPAAVSLLCLSDLLALENNEPLRAYVNGVELREEPPQKLQIECAMLRRLTDAYDTFSSEVLRYNAEDYEWLAAFYREILRQCVENGIDPQTSFFTEHPIYQQFLIAMLREPVWRMPVLTPLDGTMYDQDSYVDAPNSFYEYLESRTQSPQLTVEPAVEDLAALCTETAVWTMRQAEDFVVTLDIALEDGSTVTLTYTP